jgi:hypothetical protein
MFGSEEHLALMFLARAPRRAPMLQRAAERRPPSPQLEAGATPLSPIPPLVEQLDGKRTGQAESKPG